MINRTGKARRFGLEKPNDSEWKNQTKRIGKLDKGSPLPKLTDCLKKADETDWNHLEKRGLGFESYQSFFFKKQPNETD